MLIKPNWDIFKAKFSENPQNNFEWLCYLLFSKEYNQPYGTHRYKNQSGIETDPIQVEDEVIGWQSKFYEDSLSNHKDDLLGTLTKTKRDNPNITKIILYTNSEWGQGQGTKEPKAKTEAEKKAKELGIDLVWRVQSYFKSSFVCQKQQDISRYFFELNSKWELTNLGFIDTIKDRYKTTFKNACEYIVEDSFSLKKEPELPSEIIENSIKETNIKNILLESNKSLILIKSTTFVKTTEDKPEFVVELFLANNKNNLLSNYRLIPNRNLNKVTFINDSEIDRIVLNILSKIDYKDGIVDLNKIIRFVENKNNIYTKYNQSLEKDVLGEIDFEKSVISIDNYQCETLARIRFTLAHEIGHFLLGHSKYLLTEKYTKQDAETINSQNIIKIEFQANQFASFLLLPTKSFLKDFYALLKKYNVRNKGLGLFVDNQKCNINTYMKVTSRLMHKYKVSRQVIEIRLKKLGLLNKVDTYELVKDVHQEIINKKIDWNYYD